MHSARKNNFSNLVTFPRIFSEVNRSPNGSKEGIERKVVVCPVYFQSDAEESPPPQQIRELIINCKADGLDLVFGCDANTHHTVWGSSNCNREEACLEFLCTLKVDRNASNGR